MSFRESRSQINGFAAKRQLTADLKRVHRSDQHSRTQHQGPLRARREPLRQWPAVPHLLRQRRTGRRVAEAGQGDRTRLPIGQAGRPELRGSELRHPGRGGRSRRHAADLVAPEQQARLISPEDKGLAARRGLSRVSAHRSHLLVLLHQKGIAITAAPLASLQTVKCEIGIVGRIECLHHRLAARSDPAPIANERCTAEQRRLNGEAVESPHVLCQVDAA